MVKLIAEFIEDSELVRCTSINGAERKTFSVSLSNFRESLVAGNVAGTEWSAPLGPLPKGYLNARFGTSSVDGITADVIIRNPSEQRLITFCGESFFIPIPALVFRLVFKNGKLVEDAVYACRPGTDELCIYPFSNVYDDGHICWGSNTLPLIKTIKDVEDIVELFLRSNNNADLVKEKMMNVFECSSLGEIFKKLEKLGVYPLSGYVNYGLTINDLFL